MRTRRITMALIVGLGLTMGLLLVLNGAAVLPVHAAPPPTYRYVATTGTDTFNDCRTSTSPCGTLQHAVNVAGSNNVILVAKGIYDDLHTHSIPAGYMAPPASGVITQVLYVGKTVAIRGGYTTDFKEPPDPSSNSTTLRVPAGQRGRVVVIAGDIQPTLYGLRIVDGDATGLGGGWGNRDAGGGVYIFTATATLDTNTVFSNVAYDGGGLYLVNSAATLVDNLITENTADGGGGTGGSGGGLYLHASDATLSDNTIYVNIANLHGGAAYLNYSKAELTGNTMFSNHATTGAGGALHLVWYSEATITGNTIESNTAGSQGGGMYLNYSDAVLEANTIGSKTADDDGGGLALENDCSASLTANVIVSNDAGGRGGGVYIRYIWGNPRFSADGYHLSSDSAALDVGLSSGVTADVDGDTRPYCTAPDLGADEAVGGFACQIVYLPAALRND
ncbi:MAG: right-handed parallel beta-helix repeat-containing protein [Anaerolineae bacterium]|nr:right-handed parallel beta-helix repeat-containing protein [Anaerolineae bacterium]